MYRPSLVRAGLALALVAGAAVPAVAQSKMSASDLRVALNETLSQHVYLAAAATNAALGGRSDEFKAAAGALDANSVALSKAIGLAYGADAEQPFLALWRKHIGMVVDYTTGLATKDKMKSDKAVNDLLGYANDFGAFLNSASPALPKEAVAGLVKTHIVSLKDVIDLQAAGKSADAYAKLRDAAHHMQMIGDPLAATISKQFPAKFAMM